MSNLTTAPHRTIAPIDNAMIYAVLAAGTAAALTVDSRFWLATPVVGIVLMLASKRAAPAADTSESETSQLPAHVESAIEDAVAQLPPGDARRLLGDVVRQARPLFGSVTSSNFDAGSDQMVRSEAAELVLACCDTALELGRLDSVLASDARANKQKQRTHDQQLFERFSAARTHFSTRLTDAASALGALYVSGIEQGTPASDRVAELVSDVNTDAKARSAATLELDQLLGTGKRIRASTSSKV